MMMQQQQQQGRRIRSCSSNGMQYGKDFRPCVSCTHQCYKLHGEIHEKAVQRRLEKMDQLKYVCGSSSGGSNRITDHLQGMSCSCCSVKQLMNNEPYFVKPMIKGCLPYAQRSWMGIPVGFAENFPDSMKNETLTLEGPSGDHWVVELKNYTKNPSIAKGWRAFSYDHNLKQDDQLHFSLADVTHFVVDIFTRDGIATLDASSLENYCKRSKMVEVWSSSDDSDDPSYDQQLGDVQAKSPPIWGAAFDRCKPNSRKRLQKSEGTQGFSKRKRLLGDHGSALCIELSSSSDEEEDDDDIAHGSPQRSPSSTQKKKGKMDGPAGLSQGGHELGETYDEGDEFTDQDNVDSPEMEIPKDPLSQFTKMFQSCSRNAAKKSVKVIPDPPMVTQASAKEEKGTPPARTACLPAVRLFSTAPATPSAKSGVIAADGVKKEKESIMNPGSTNRKYSCVLVSKRGPVTEEERDKALKAAREFAENCKNPYYLVVLKASQVYRFFELDLPLEFVADPAQIPNDQRRLSVTLVDQISDHPWKAKLWLEMPPKKPRLSFMEFARSHYLEEGDVCVFELTDNAEFTLSVSLFRILEIILPLTVESKQLPDHGWRQHYEIYSQRARVLNVVAQEKSVKR